MGWIGSRGRGTFTALVGVAVLGLVASLIAAIVGVASLEPTPRGAMAWRNPIPVDQELRASARASQWPMLWVGEICDSPLYQLRGPQQLRNAAYAATCLSKVKPGGEADYLMFARYATADGALQDLHNEGYTFFVLRPWRDMLFMAATVSDETVVDGHGDTVAPSLQPLEVFSLPIQRAPEAP